MSDVEHETATKLRVAVVGGGLVGALEACLMARRGCEVVLFEGRHDGRAEPSYYGRSINLAISHRGISALERCQLHYLVQECAIPMHSRMIHTPSGQLNQIPYDPQGRCINSIERASLNNYLLNQAEQTFKVEIKFNHKLVDMDADKGELMFRVTTNNEPEDKLRRYQFDIILGCDGARSAVRSLMARQSNLELNQTFIEHGYVELRIDADDKTGGYKMAHNYLHIWPRGQYMMIALPNKDFSFTCTLFMPYEIFEQVRDPVAALQLFNTQFKDAIPLIGVEQISSTLSQVRPSPLISIKCKPYVSKGKIVLMGDSAHAMVPFYGQGMNCGFEDCLVLDELLDKHLDISTQTKEQCLQGFEKALSEYDSIRCSNGHAMCELAMYNYVEMRDLVNKKSFLVRKYFDNFMFKLFPSRWIPLYTMVTFSRIPIDECVRRREQQDKTLSKLVKFLYMTTFALGAAYLVKKADARECFMMHVHRFSDQFKPNTQ